jgi:7-cyano-7-deazaguanine synthase
MKYISRVMVVVAKRRVAVILLLSGGIDSAACLNYYTSKRYSVKAVFVDYGQKANRMELSSARALTAHYRVPLQELRLDAGIRFGEGEVFCRNAVLLLSALMANPAFKGIVSIGIHSDSPYYDCSNSFVSLMKRLISDYSDGRVLLDVPFLLWNKRMIFDYAKGHRVPLSLTYSCERGRKKPCGECLSCLDVRALNAI